jgi:phage baseplate assembly protein W
MTTHRYRAWHFSIPGDSASSTGGLTISTTGGVEMVYGSASVRQSILLLLATIPGERVMRPDYGCDLHRLIFSPNDETTAGLAIHYIRQALDRWERRAEVLRLDAGRNPEIPGRLDIVLDYRVRATHDEQTVTLSVDLAGDRL